MNKNVEQKKTGCVGYAYVYLFVSTILLAGSISFVFMADTLTTFYKGVQKQSYQAEVVDYEFSIRKKADEQISFHEPFAKTPIVQFITKSNDTITRELDFSSEELPQSYHIKYDEKTGEIIIWGLVFILKMMTSVIFSYLFGSFIVGLLVYVFNGNIKKAFKILYSIALNVFLPLYLIAFEALLIHTYYNEDVEPFWIKILLVLFIMVLGFVILLLLHSIYKRKFNKHKREIRL